MMANGKLLPAKNLGQNVVARVDHGPHTGLTAVAERYLLTQVAGQAEGTQDAKRCGTSNHETC
jgi:hypothetical protein